MNLQQEIDARESEIRTDGYSMTIGEFISLYEHRELDIHPKFRRFFHWDIWKKSQLIESILIGIPLPSVSVLQDEDGAWHALDGLQRLSTIFEFVGILKDEHQTLVPPLKLAKTKYLPSLEGFFWDDDSFQRQQILPEQPSLTDEEDSHPKILTSMQRFSFRRATMRVNIITRKGDENSKYDLFQRLNTSGSSLSNQKLLNCILVSLNSERYNWLEDLSQDANFMNCVNLTDKGLIEQYDMELVLRFLIFRNIEEKELECLGDLDEFLMDKTIALATSKGFDRVKEGRYFRETFELLARTAKGDSFRKYDAIKDKFTGGFLTSAFDMVALGIGHAIDLVDIEKIEVEAKIKQIWQMQEFTECTSSEFRTPTQMMKIILLGRRVFQL